MSQNSVFLRSLKKIDSSWKDFLNQHVVDNLQQIENLVIKPENEFTPPKDKVLRFLENSIYDLKIIILGQDPYPQKGVATGRAFEVGTLQSWNDTFNNISLKNIVRAIYKAYKDDHLKYSEIKKDIGLYFPLKSPMELFVAWEKQGVLLLNTSFTCEVGKSNSHEKYWKEFTQNLLHYIASKNKNITWFLWGNNAKSIVSGIPILRKIESMHPMMCYQNTDRQDDFLFGKTNCFSETKDIINWLG